LEKHTLNGLRDIFLSGRVLYAPTITRRAGLFESLIGKTIDKVELWTLSPNTIGNGFWSAIIPPIGRMLRNHPSTTGIIALIIRK
jgi:hypothetical protein